MTVTVSLSPDPATARRIVSLMDLTSLNETDDEAAIVRLSGLAVSRLGTVAALCTWPQFMPVARNALRGTGVRIAAVANFPAGTATVEQAAAATETSIRGLRALMDALVGLNLLARRGQRYMLTPESSAFLVSTKPG